MREFFIIKTINAAYGGPEDGDSPQLMGPFPSHQKANAAMQQLYDDACEELPDANGDDSEASHFYLEDEEQIVHWHIVEMGED